MFLNFLASSCSSIQCPNVNHFLSLFFLLTLRWQVLGLTSRKGFKTQKFLVNDNFGCGLWSTSVFSQSEHFPSNVTLVLPQPCHFLSGLAIPCLCPYSTWTSQVDPWFFFFYYGCCCYCTGHLQRFLQCIKYIILEFTPSTALFDPLSWFLEQFQQVSFLHLLTCGPLGFCMPPFNSHLTVPPSGQKWPLSPPAVKLRWQTWWICLPSGNSMTSSFLLHSAACKSPKE
jgi:hypothetical protein